MSDFEFPKKKKKEIGDLNVVPILDMFVSIVFFLLLSASMVGMTKLVLPPSSTASVESKETKIPINAKLIVQAAQTGSHAVKLLLRWEGATPGEDQLELNENILEGQEKSVKEIQKLIKKFKDQYPEERTIQISMQSEVIYQWLISAMDGVRDLLPDVVLVSYTMADGIKE